MPQQPYDLILALHNGVPLELDAASRLKHLHICGGTGSGKSTLLRNLIAQDLAAGNGITVIDPLGSLADSVLGLVPRHRTNDVIYCSPARLDRPVGLNMLERVHPDSHANVADAIVSAFIDAWNDQAIGDRSQQVLRNSVRALLCQPSATLLGIPKLLTDPIYRARVVRSVHDPVVLSYWERQFEPMTETRRTEVISPILNKLDAVLSAPSIRNVVGSVTSTFNMRRVLDERRILIVNLAGIGEQNARLLGSLLVTQITQAALARIDTPPEARVPHFVYLDEFQNVAGGGIVRTITQARAFAIGLTVGHQHIDQLTEETRAALFGNCGTTVVLRVGALDAPIFAAHLGLEPELEMAGLGTHETPPEKVLSMQPNFRAVVRTLQADVPTPALSVQLLPDPRPVNARTDTLIAHSLKVFSNDRREIEAKIARFLTDTPKPKPRRMKKPRLATKRIDRVTQSELARFLNT